MLEAKVHRQAGREESKKVGTSQRTDRKACCFMLLLLLVILASAETRAFCHGVEHIYTTHGQVSEKMKIQGEGKVTEGPLLGPELVWISEYLSILHEEI